jgi:hypothetical protein
MMTQLSQAQRNWPKARRRLLTTAAISRENDASVATASTKRASGKSIAPFSRMDVAPAA